MATPAPAPFTQPQGNGIATAAMVCGILGIALCWVPLAGIVLALLGIIFGGIGISKSGRLGGRGRGKAIAGLVCGILTFVLGLAAAIAIPAFLEYMHKGKKTESSLQLRSIETKVKSFYNETRRLPQGASEMPGPVASACRNEGRIPRKSQSEWDAAGWRELGFHVDEDSRYSYRWVVESASGANAHGYAEAVIDADCDGTASVTRVDFQVVEGNLMVRYSDPTPD